MDFVMDDEKSDNSKRKIEPKRKCVTCKKPTDDWRCPVCWKKIRKENGYSSSVSEDEDNDTAYW
jgi:predicted amidophosphoribosyltransferase